MKKISAPSTETAKVKKAARFAKREALVESLHRVVAAYVANLGGVVIVSGPIQLITYSPGERRKFSISIECMGRKP